MTLAWERDDLKGEEQKQQEAAKKVTPVIKQENATEYKKKNEELISQLSNKQFWAWASKYQKAIWKAQTQTQYQVSPEARMDLARFNYKQEKWRDWNDKEVWDYLNKNQLKIEKALYGSLAKQARDKWIDLSNDQFYHSYLWDTLKSQTPKQKEESFWTKVWNIAKGIFLDTPVWLASMASDQVFWTNFYKDYFWDRTQLKAHEGFGKQFTDLMIDQGAIVDAWIALWSFFSGWTAAPALIAARTAIKWWMKAVTKWMFKTLEKWVMKEWVELFEKTVTKNLWEDVYKALKWEWDLAKIIADKGEDWLKFLTRMKIVLKDAWEEALKWTWNPKLAKKFYNKVDEIHDSLSVWSWFMKTTGKEKIAEWINVAIDALWLPNFIWFKAVNVWGKEIIKWNKPSFVKTMVNYVMPASPLLPWVGQWMESTWLRLWSVIAQKFTEQTRTWIIDVEREKFMQAYGVDPEKSTGELRKNWENFVNFKLKNSTISEALTWVQREDRWLAGQWWFWLVDVLWDFIWPMLWIKAFGKAHQIAENKLSPFTTDAKWNIVSNIGYIAKLEEIQKTNYATKEERQTAIDNLHAEIEKGWTNLITTIQSTKELENGINEIMHYYENSGKQMTEYDQIYVEKVQEAKDLFSQWNAKWASDKIMEAENFQNMAVYSVFNSERLKNVKEKIDAVNKYFDKLRNSVSLVDTLTKWFAVNFFTKNITSASGAIIRWTDSLVASAKSIFNDIDNRNQKIVDIYEQRWKALNNIFKWEWGWIDIIKSKIVDWLTNDKVDPKDAEKVADILWNDVHNVLTKAYLDIKELWDYNVGKLFDEVFWGFWLNNLVEKINEVTWKDQASWDKIWTLIMKMRWNPEWKVRLSEAVENMIQEKILLQKKSAPDTQMIIESKAKELMMLNQLKADIASKVNQSNEMSRKQMVFEDTKKVEVDVDAKIKELEKEKTDLEEQQKKWFIVDGKLKSVNEAIDILKEAKEEWNKTVEERVAVTDKEQDILKDNPNLENIRSEDAHLEKVTKEIEESHKNEQIDNEQLSKELDNLSQAVANIAKNHTLLNSFLVQQRLTSDLPANKLDDDMYRHEDLLNASESFIIQKISNYADFSKNAFKADWTLDLDSLKKYDKVFVERLEKLWKEESSKFIEKNKWWKLTKTQKIALSKMVANIQKQMWEWVNRQNLIKLAKESIDYHQFVDNLKYTIQTHYWFTPEATEKFIINTFWWKDIDWKTSIHNEKLIPFYNLYKNTYKIEMANIDISNGKVTLSTDWPEASEQFLDQMGWDSSQYRIKWIEQEKLEQDYDIFFVNDILKDWESTMPDQFFTKDQSKDATNKQVWNNEIWPKVTEEMQKKWFFFLGSFQEEWKKMLFVKPKQGKVWDWNDAMFKLTWVDFKQIDWIKDFNTKNQIMSNFAKYAKLLLWWEIKVDNQVFKEITGRDNVIHIVFDDKQLVDTDNVDVYDWRTLSFDHYQDAINKTIWANPNNDSHKTATSVWDWMFIKSKDWRANADIFLDTWMRTAFEKFFEQKGLFAEDIADPNWFQNKEVRERIFDEIIDNRLVDRIVPLSALKNIYTRKVKNIEVDANWNKSIEWIQFKEYWHWDVFETPVEKIWVKTHDETKTSSYAKEETIKLSNQFLRNINLDYPGWKEAWKIFFKAFNEVREKDFDKLFNIIKEVGWDPMLTIQRFEQEFWVKYTDYEKQSFITSAQADNLLNMASNIMKDHITTWITVKGNKLDLTYIPDYAHIRNAINEKLWDNNKDNFIILDKDVYNHLDKDINRDKDWNLRFVMFRYPIVSRRVLTAPVIIWKQDLSWMLGYDYDPHIWSAVAPSHKIIKRVEWDWDWDSLYLVTDDKLAYTNPALFKYIDTVFKDEKEITVDNKSANLQNTVEWTEWDAEKLFNIISFDTFEGKANIWKIDTDFNKYETMTRLWLATEDVDETRFLFWETNQRAVDNKTVNINNLKKEVDSKIWKWLKEVYSSNKWWITPSDNLKANFWKIKVQTWTLKNWKPKYTFLSNIHFTNDKAAISFLKDIDKLINLPWWKVRSADEKGYINIPMSKELQDTYWQYNLNRIKDAISSIYWFVWKYDYSEWFPKNKSIKDLPKNFNQVKKDVDFIKEHFPEAYEWDPQLSFMVDMADKFAHWVFSSFKTDLDDTINKAYQKEEKNYTDEWTESHPWWMKALKDEIANYQKLSWTHYSRFNEIINKEQSELNNNEKETLDYFKKLWIDKAENPIEFRQLVKKWLSKIRSEILEISTKNPNLNIDNIIIGRSWWSQVTLAKDLLSAETKQALDKWIVFNLYKGQIEKIQSYLKDNIDMDTIEEHYWKSDVDVFMKAFDESIKIHEDLTQQDNPREAIIKQNWWKFENALESNTAVILAKLANKNVVNHDTLKKTITTIQTLSPEDRLQVFRWFQDFKQEDIDALAQTLWETEIENIWASEILNLFATKAISDKIIAEDFKNAKPIIQDNATNFTNKNC